MIGVNKVILVGRVASDVDGRTTRTGKHLAKFAVAIPRRDAAGNDAVDFFDITTWNRTAEACAKYVRKGEKIYIEGRLNRSVWEGGDGQKRSRVGVSATFVNFLGSPARPQPAAEAQTDEEPAEAEVPAEAQAAS
jgi:single-strand DNA-binding protein